MENTINLNLTYDLSIKCNNIIILVVSLFVLVFTAGCGIKSTQGNDDNEVVLLPGMSITAENKNGKLVIQAGENYHRSFNWAGESRSVIMLPRTKRWNGSLGLYYPGRGNHWKEHDGITRAVVDEGILNFESLTDIMEYIGRYEDKNSLVYSDEGLFVFWDKSRGAGGTLNVQLWQFLIKGDKPRLIPGSANIKIRISRK